MTWTGGWTVSAKSGGLTLSLGFRRMYSYDEEGRVFHAWEDGVTYRRGLDGRVLVKGATPGRGLEGLLGRRIRFCTSEEADAFLRRAHAAAVAAAEERDGQGGCRGGGSAGTSAAEDGVTAWLARAAAWGPDRLKDDARRFAAVYKPISILPPDQYRAIVVQLTEGCSWNRCTFCNFYLDRPFRVKGGGELAAHLEGVRRLLGKTVASRRSLFLADGNALVLPANLLAERVALVRAAFPQVGPLYGFLDVFHAVRRGEGDLERLGAMGVDRVYLGVETGHDPLLRWLDKPGTAADALAVVRRLRDAGVAVGVILMLGVGGERFAEGHRADTCRLLRAMALGRRDIVYLSPFVAHEGSVYTARARAAGVHPVSTEELVAQAEAFRSAALGEAAPAAVSDGEGFGAATTARAVTTSEPATGGPRVSFYDIREFLY
ncbi:MAG: radical SAM protein [Clostridia bacterium]|nr:radical SAM protein [Clostridia bacterium]